MRVSSEGEDTLLFAHGFGCDQAMCRFVAPAFALTRRVVLFDYAGHGGGDPESYDSERHSSRLNLKQVFARLILTSPVSLLVSHSSPIIVT